MRATGLAAPGAGRAPRVRLGDVDATEFEALRPRLEAIAYRMTGSAADAQDLGQEAWLRWSAADRSDVEDPEAYLVRVVTRLAMDRLGSAARRRESYVGPYLPEPVVAPLDSLEGSQPEDHAVLADSLTYSFLVLLDELGPVERAVLLLHDVFGYPFEEVAAAVGRSVPSVRQVASRPRRRIAAARPGWDPEAGPDAARRPAAEVADATMAGFLQAMVTGDVEGLLALLAPDVVTISDGGPLQRAARRPVVGPDRVARLLLWLNRRGVELGLGARLVAVNGRVGLLLALPDGAPYTVVTWELDEAGRIVRVFLQLNPDKLRHLADADG